MKFKLMGAAATAALLVAAPAAFAQQKSDEGKSGAPQAQSGPSGSSGQSSAAPSAKGEGSEQQKGQGQSKGDVTKGAQSGSKDQSGSKAKSADQGEPKGKSGAQSEPKGSKQGEPKASAQGSKEPMNKGAEQKSSKDTQQKSTKDSAQKSSKDQDRKGTAQKSDGSKQPSSSSASDSTKGASGKDTAAGKDGRAGKDAMAAKDGGKSGDRVQVSQEQRVSIHQNILKSGRPNRVDKVNFSISIGTRVPRSVHLVALPAAVLTIVPAYRNYRYVMVHDEIVIIEPSTYEIVEVINVSSQTASHGGGGSATLVLTDEERAILMNEIDMRGSSTLGLGTLTEGADVPRSVEVRVFPETVVQKVQKLHGYKFFTAENRIAIVDPQGSKVKLVIEGRR